MAETSQRQCDRCPRPILPHPELGDKQGGHHRVAFPAYVVEVDLCEKCVDEATLNEIRNLRFQAGVTHYKNTGESRPLSKLPIYDTLND